MLDCFLDTGRTRITGSSGENFTLISLFSREQRRFAVEVGLTIYSFGFRLKVGFMYSTSSF